MKNIVYVVEENKVGRIFGNKYVIKDASQNMTIAEMIEENN